nr:hypothetical protein [Tanacetum cinerariifolium]
MSAPYVIILFDSKDEFETPDPPSNMSMYDDEEEPFEDEPMENDQNEWTLLLLLLSLSNPLLSPSDGWMIDDRIGYPKTSRLGEMKRDYQEYKSDAYDASGKREIHSLQGQLDEFPLSNVETCQDEVNGVYNRACNTQEEMETMHAQLEEARA